MKGTAQMGKNGSGSEAKGNGLAHGNYSRLGLPVSLPVMCLSAKWEQ